MWHLNKSRLINCSIVICSVGNLLNRVIVQLHLVHLFFVQLLIYSIDFCLVSFLFKSFVQLALFKTTSINWQGRVSRVTVWYGYVGGDAAFQECFPFLGSSGMCVGKLANRMVSHDFGDFRCSSDSRATFGDVTAVRREDIARPPILQSALGW